MSNDQKKPGNDLETLVLVFEPTVESSPDRARTIREFPAVKLRLWPDFSQEERVIVLELTLDGVVVRRFAWPAEVFMEMAGNCFDEILKWQQAYIDLLVNQLSVARTPGRS